MKTKLRGIEGAGHRLFESKGDWSWRGPDAEIEFAGELFAGRKKLAQASDSPESDSRRAARRYFLSD